MDDTAAKYLHDLFDVLSAEAPLLVVSNTPVRHRHFRGFLDVLAFLFEASLSTSALVFGSTSMFSHARQPLTDLSWRPEIRSIGVGI